MAVRIADPAIHVMVEEVAAGVCDQCVDCHGKDTPYRLCKGCHNEAFAGNELVTKNFDYTCEFDDSCPLGRDWCIYHDHNDERASDACGRYGERPGSS